MGKKHITSLIIAVLVAACLSSLCTIAIVNNSVNKKIHQAVESETSHYKELLSGLDSFLEVKNLVDTGFVDEVDYETLEKLLIDEYVKLLGDKYSDYYTREELSAYMNKLSGSFVGVGIVCTQENGKILINSVVEDSPASESGILPNEKIVSVEGITVTEENYTQMVDSILGEEGTKVSFQIEGIDGVVRSVTLERRKIITKTIYSEMLEGNIGYVKITQFATNTYEAFETALDSLLKQGAKSFLFDVRDNSGGELNCVIKILDRLLGDGPIVHIVDGTGKVETKYSTSEKSVELPMAVLINEKTASAAELFSSAIRDYQKGELFGKNTYGKGYMQRIITLSDGSGLKLSIAKYNPPCGVNYETIGVSPHVEVEDNASTENDEQKEKAIEYLRSIK